MIVLFFCDIVNNLRICQWCQFGAKKIWKNRIKTNIKCKKVPKNGTKWKIWKTGPSPVVGTIIKIRFLRESFFVQKALF